MHHRVPALVAFVAASLVALPAAADDYTFHVSNNTDQRIVKIEVSEDGKSWGPFDIGRGIAAEDTVEMVWDESTDGSDCEWQFRATFEGGYVADSDWIDFCEDEVVIEFDFD